MKDVIRYKSRPKTITAEYTKLKENVATLPTTSLIDARKPSHWYFYACWREDDERGK